MVSILLFLLALILPACGFLVWPVVTLRAARRDRRADEDAVFLKEEPEQFQALIARETLGSLFLILGVFALFFGLVLTPVGWLSENKTALSLGIVLLTFAVLCCITSVIFQKRAKKRRTALRAALGTKNTADELRLGEAISDDLQERMESNVRIQKDKLQAYDMFFRK